MRILPLSTIDDNRTILQEVMRIRKYLEVNPIRNIFYINEDYEVGVISYDASKIYINSELDVEVSADDIILFKNGYIGVVDSIRSEYVTVIGGQPIRGAKGDTGATGNGITSIEKTGTSGLVDTYTITFTNGSTTVFTITNGANGQEGATGATGNGIASIEKTGTSGLVDTYTITFTNGTTATFTVTNGANGQNGVGVPAGGTDGQVLTKDGDTDYSTKWADPPSGGGVNIIGENLLINPDFAINQRGVATTSTVLDSNKYTADRWYGKSGATVQATSPFNLTNGRIEQYIDGFTNSKWCKYFICGVHYNSSIPDSGTPSVKLGWYNNTLTELTHVNETPITVTIGGHTQLVNIYENPFTTTEYRLVFGIEATNIVNLLDAFCYCCDSYDNTAITTSSFPVIVNPTVELEKCKFYFEQVGKYIQSSNNGSIGLVNACTFTSFNYTYGVVGVIYVSKKRIVPTLSYTERNVSITKEDLSSEATNSPDIYFIDSPSRLTIYATLNAGSPPSPIIASQMRIIMSLDAEIYPS